MFVVSWVNPDEASAAKKLRGLHASRGRSPRSTRSKQATGEREANVIGYCLGGTLLAATLAYMAAKRDNRIKSATFFVTMVDFAEAGELSRLHRRGAARGARRAHGEEGLSRRPRDGDDLQHAARQRPDLVVRRQQLPARANRRSRSTCSIGMPTRRACRRRCTAFTCATCTRRTCWCEPGGITLSGVPIDLRKIRTPAFLLSTREDHIAPWRSTYAATQIYRGPGQIRAVGLGPHRRRGQSAGRQIRAIGKTMTTRRPRRNGSPAPTQHAGSWWPAWERWVAKYAGGEVPARQPGDGKAETDRGCPRLLRQSPRRGLIRDRRPRVWDLRGAAY